MEYTRFRSMQIKIYKFRYQAFNLVELLTVVAIAAIIAAFSVPAYFNNVKATRLNSLYLQLEPAKQYVEERYLRYHEDPSTITVASGSHSVTAGDSLTNAHCVTIQAGVVAALLVSDLVTTDALWVAWTPTLVGGQITWACTYPAAAADLIGSIATNCSVGTAPAFGDDSGCA